MKCIFAIPLCLLSFAVCACAVKTTPHTFSENTYWLEAKLEYPSFSGCDALNAAIANYVLSEYQQFKAEQEAVWNAIEAENAEYGLTYENQQFGYLANAEKTLVGKRYVNVLLNVWTFTGGAHGVSSFKSFVYDRKRKSLVSAPTDFGMTYKELASACRSFLDEHLPAYDTTEEYLTQRKKWITEGTEPTAEHYDTFTYDGRTLTIYFDAYQVAPYSEGVQSVPIALAAVR